MSKISRGTATRERRTDREHAPSEKLPLVHISIGEVFATDRPTMLQTVLGSCVAACLMDPLSGIGGMNHILFPEASNHEHSARFGVHAMELLINEMMKLGGDRRRFVAKAFGAGHVLPCITAPRVGEKNAKFIRGFLETERIPVLAQRLGGKDAVHVSFRTDTGRVIIRTLSGCPLSTVVAQEQTYVRTRPASRTDDEDVTLF